MKFKLTRGSNIRKDVPVEDRIKEIEINALEELLEFINKEDTNVLISPPDGNGCYWINVDDFFEE